MSYAATVLADSEFQDQRLVTIEVTFPRFILAEVNTHRMLSRNSASSRAIPTLKLIARVEDHPFIPETFNKKVTGMGVGDPLSPIEQAEAEAEWKIAINMAICQARALLKINDDGLDKSRVNRLLEPFMWHTAIITATDWDNFFALRDHPDAQPEFRTLAGMMLDAMRGSVPNPMPLGQWHLPLVTNDELDLVRDGKVNWEYMAMVSAGRCARVSFDRHGEFEPVEDSHARARKLKDSGHLSPMEHPATPGETSLYYGNFRGWRQLRKTIPFEENLVGINEGREPWNS